MKDNPNDYVLSFSQLKSFYENVEGIENIDTYAQNYTDDLEGLANTIHKLYPYIKTKSLKNRSTRIEKKLRLIVEQNSLKKTDASETNKLSNTQ